MTPKQIAEQGISPREIALRGIKLREAATQGEWLLTKAKDDPGVASLDKGGCLVCVNASPQAVNDAEFETFAANHFTQLADAYLEVVEVMEGYKDRINFGADPMDILNQAYHAMHGRLELLDKQAEWVSKELERLSQLAEEGRE